MYITANVTMNSQELKPGQLTDHHYINYSPGRKSNLRLNDQLIPKPTDIDMGEKIINVATPKEHPYASHIPRFDMFPSYISSDDPAKVEAPTSPPDVTLLSKTKGAPYRHELLKPLTASKKAVRWSGEHSFLEYPKPFKGESQVIYPTPTKIMRPRTKPNWDLPLFEETSNMLKNVKRSHWRTSYQMDYSGSEKANLKIYDFKKKHSSPAGMNMHTAPMMEKPVSVFEASKLNEGCRRTKGPCLGMMGPTAHVPVTVPASASASPRPQESAAHYNETPWPNQRGHSQSAEAQSADLSHRGSHKHRAGSSKCESRENITQQFKKQQISMAQSNYEANQNTDAEKHQGHGEKSSNGASDEINYCSVGKDQSISMAGLQLHTSNMNILPRPPALPGICPVTEEGIVSLRELQDSFSKTQAHHNFNSSITQSPVNLRDNVFTGRRHDFYGVNAFYLHG